MPAAQTTAATCLPAGARTVAKPGPIQQAVRHPNHQMLWLSAAESRPRCVIKASAPPPHQAGSVPPIPPPRRPQSMRAAAQPPKRPRRSPPVSFARHTRSALCPLLLSFRLKPATPSDPPACRRMPSCGASLIAATLKPARAWRIRAIFHGASRHLASAPCGPAMLLRVHAQQSVLDLVQTGSQSRAPTGCRSRSQRGARRGRSARQCRLSAWPVSAPGFWKLFGQ